jgi:3-deoxy-manno-octulosonate cytidylyltransferase (CMP-KDO synthetase)
VTKIHPSDTLVVIPSRYASTRFPGKPLVKIAGKSLLERVWAIAKAAKGVDRVVIATDDEKIQQHAQTFGAEVAMTDPRCKNGTERVHQTLEILKIAPEIVVNFQGDAVLTPPSIIQALVSVLKADRSIQMATPAVRLTAKQYDEIRQAKESGETGGTFVVFDKNQNALYFSKSPIPHLREPVPARPPVFRHVGMYAYTSATLKKYLALSQTPLEQAEQLEQLRALESGIPIRVVEVSYSGRTAWSVDTPDDARKVESIIAREGELIPL